MDKKQKPKIHFYVYRIEEHVCPGGNTVIRRDYVGETWAVSAAKARVNVEYRLRGKAQYCGYDLVDLGADQAIRIRYEAEEAA